MKLFELAFTSFTFNAYNPFENSYFNFLDEANNSLDLQVEEHREALLVWLNSWGCRQFKVNCHPIASKNILDWYKNFSKYLPDKNLWELDETDYKSIEILFDSLRKTLVSKRIKNQEKEENVTVGPTGASKILFALRSKSLIPLDIPMRKHFKLKDSSEGYIKYLKIIKNIIIELGKECKQNGFEIEDIPEQIKSPNLTLPHIIDEYHWYTISNNPKTDNKKIPSQELLEKWFRWSKY